MCGVAFSCWKIALRDRCPSRFLLIASHATSQHVAVGVHVYGCTVTHEFNVNDSFILQYRCHTCSSRLTRFEYYGSRSRWIFFQHENLFCLRPEMVYRLSCGCHEIISFVFKALKMWKGNLEASIFLLFFQTSWCPACRNVAVFQIVSGGVM